ncbi:MAG: gliding motility-associated C-terminal domain-containing protein, partial [Flammeovirgaceae bacterium]|nr:gliding motility-associated C-terminal domain-containing protein [Flammeovirgaceae bacterium]MDW8288800.1 gliding motility-associated C-terminal domain-containing protein [Flammeovirgaceae bacterium]
INDIFQPLRCPLFVKTVSVKIFNRWGEEVFSTNNINVEWNGKNKSGRDVSEGVYYYVATVTFVRLREEDEKPFELKGTIHLIRSN